MTDPARKTLLPSLLAAVALLLAVGTAGASTGSRAAEPLRGLPLGATGLHLLVSDIPPFVFDVDTGRVTRLDKAATPPPAVLWVTGVAGRAGVVAADNLGDARLTAVRGKARRLSPLGRGRNVWPAAGGRAVWIESRVDGSRCTLRQVALDGHTLRARRSLPCTSATTAQVAGSTGLVWSPTRVIDPASGATTIDAPLPIIALAGDVLVLDGPGDALSLLNAKTGTRRELPWPSDHGALDTPAVSPDTRYVALAFANPSFTSPAGQFSDLWLLDTVTAELKQLPGMPAFVALKATSIAWTPDGRLVLLAESGGKDMVAVWRPGQAKLHVKTLRLPERDGSSDTFAILP